MPAAANTPEPAPRFAVQAAVQPDTASAASPIPTRFLGCDVGKAGIVVFDSRDASLRTLPNQPDSLATFAAGLDPTCLVVCEATGGYEDALLAALLTAGCPAHRADARKVKAFIRSFGTLAKSDTLDARALAHYAQERHARLARWQAPDPDRERLQTLVLTRADLVAQRTACTNRLAAPGAEPVRTCLEALRTCLDTQIQALDAAIAALVRAAAELVRAERVLRAIPGIGATTAAALIGLMPRTRPHRPPSGRRPGRRRPPPQPERRHRRLSPNPRRQARGQAHPVHGRDGGQPPQPHPPGRLPAPARRRKEAHRRHHSPHATPHRHRKRTPARRIRSSRRQLS